jgi:hypothetical protein
MLHRVKKKGNIGTKYSISQSGTTFKLVFILMGNACVDFFT